ncbi:MAG: serine/threonine-protein kinase [Polyangiaceae bacterium]
MLCPRCHRSYPDSEKRCQYDGETLTDGRKIDFVRAGRTRHIGAILGGRFQIRGFIGQGGTSRVYLAEDIESGEPVALKILEPPWAHDRVARERFLQEAEAARTIDHPGIVDIVFVGQRGDGTPYFVMEFLFGESLADCLTRAAKLELDLFIPIMREIALTVGAAHKKGIVHRDLKPDNIYLVGEAGEPYAVKLLDFGLAKLRDSTITAAGVAVGTVGYMAPEQCVADPVDQRTDIYGFGVTAFRTLTGRMPFSATASDELLALNLIAPAPSAANVAGVDPLLSAIIEKCLRKNPEQRYPSAEALVADLDAIADGRDPTAMTDEAQDTDIYLPRGHFSKLVAKQLYRRLGVPAPTRVS